MEVKGQLINSSSYSSSGNTFPSTTCSASFRWHTVNLKPHPLFSALPLLSAEALQRELCPRIRLERVQELLEKQKSLQQVLSLRLKELRRVCLQEAVRNHDRRRTGSQWEGLRRWICCFEKLDFPNLGLLCFLDHHSHH